LKIDFDKNITDDFDEIQFSIGIDSLTNVSGAMGGDLDPVNGMYWSWQSGYINFKVEGNSEKSGAVHKDFQFHIGGYLKPFETLQTVILPLKRNQNVIFVDVSRFLSEIDLKKHIPSCHREKKQRLLPVYFRKYFTQNLNNFSDKSMIMKDKGQSHPVIKGMLKYIPVFLFLVPLLAFTFKDLYPLYIPEYFPKPVYDFKKEPLTKEKVELGRVLFYDPILSKDGTVSCASCHTSYNAFAHNDHALSHGIGDSIGKEMLRRCLIWRGRKILCGMVQLIILKFRL
jgi:hypothetical protein